MPLAALAAGPAVHEPSRTFANLSPGSHARQRQLQRHAERGSAPDDFRLSGARERRVDRQRMRETERERLRHRRPKRRRRIGKGIVRERAEHEPIDAGGGAVHARLSEQDHVSARQIHVLVGRVVGGRAPFDRPMVRRVHVAHVDGQRHQRTRAAAERLGGEQFAQGGLLGGLPGEADAHVDRLHGSPRAASSARSTALSRPPEMQNGCLHLVTWRIGELVI